MADPGPATAGRTRPHRTRTRLRAPSVQLLSAETVDAYHAITAGGRPYRIKPSWDFLLAAAQLLLLYDVRPRAYGQWQLRRALNSAAAQRWPTFRLQLFAVLWEYGTGAPPSRVTRRRMEHARRVLTNWDGGRAGRPIGTHGRLPGRHSTKPPLQKGGGPRGWRYWGKSQPKAAGRFRPLAEGEKPWHQ